MSTQIPHSETRHDEQEPERAQPFRPMQVSASSQLADSIAHDLRNSLGVIRNAVYVLRCRLAKTEIEPDLLSVIDDEVKLADSNLANLLELTVNREPQRTVVDLGALLGEVTSRLDFTSGVRWRSEFSASPFLLWCDAGQIRQVLHKLLQNAITSMKGRGEVTVAAWSSDGRDYLEVRDQRPGIPPELRARLFEPRPAGERSRLGFSLQICRQIAERHGGAISVQESATSGAVLRVTLPRRPATGEPQPDSRSPESD